MPRYLACELPEEIERRLFAVSQQLRVEPVAHETVDEAVWVLLQLVDLTLAYYFLRPVDLLKLGSFGHTTARLGVKTARGGMAMIITRLAHHMTPAQHAALADIMEDFVL